MSHFLTRKNSQLQFYLCQFIESYYDNFEVADKVALFGKTIVLNNIKNDVFIHIDGVFKVLQPDIKQLDEFIKLAATHDILAVVPFISDVLFNLLEKEDNLADVVEFIFSLLSQVEDQKSLALLIVSLFEHLGRGGRVAGKQFVKGPVIGKFVRFLSKFEKLTFSKVDKLVKARQVISQWFNLPLYSFTISISDAIFDEDNDLNEIDMEENKGSIIIFPQESKIIPLVKRGLFSHQLAATVLGYLANDDQLAYGLYNIFKEANYLQLSPVSVYQTALCYQFNPSEALLGQLLSKLNRNLPEVFVKSVFEEIIKSDQARTTIFSVLIAVLNFDMLQVTDFLLDWLPRNINQLTKEEVAVCKQILVGNFSWKVKKSINDLVVNKLPKELVDDMYDPNYQLVDDYNYMLFLEQLHYKHGFSQQLQNSICAQIFYVLLEESEQSINSKFVNAVKLLACLNYNNFNTLFLLNTYILNQADRKFNTREGLSALLSLILNNLNEESLKFLNESLNPFWTKKSINSFFIEDDFMISEHCQKGLVNLGCTCYFNALIQSIFYLPKVRAQILQIRQENHFTLKMAKLFEKMLFSQQPFINPTPVLNTIELSGQPINPSRQMDANELYQTILNMYSTIQGDPFEMYTKGELTTELTCLTCCNSRFNREELFSLQIDVTEGVLEDKVVQPLIEVLKGGNKIDCEICKKQTEHSRCIRITRVGDYLAIVLKRIEYNYFTETSVKKNDNISFSESLDILGERLILNGVVIHSGSASSGHYYTYVKTDNGYVEINDRNVYRRSFEDLQKEAYGGKGMNKSAYMLFYARSSEESNLQFTIPDHFKELNDINYTKSILFTEQFSTFVSKMNKDDELTNLFTTRYFVEVECRRKLKLVGAFAIINNLSSNTNLVSAENYLNDRFLDIYMSSQDDESSMMLSELLVVCFPKLCTKFLPDLLFDSNKDIRFWFLSCSSFKMLTNQEKLNKKSIIYSDNLVKASMEKRMVAGASKIYENYYAIARLHELIADESEAAIEELLGYTYSRLYSFMLYQWMRKNCFNNNECSKTVLKLIKKKITEAELCSEGGFLMFIADFIGIDDDMQLSRAVRAVKFIAQLSVENRRFYTWCETGIDFLIDIFDRYSFLVQKSDNFQEELLKLREWLDLYPVAPLYKEIEGITLFKNKLSEADTKATNEKVLARLFIIRYHFL